MDDFDDTDPELLLLITTLRTEMMAVKMILATLAARQARETQDPEKQVMTLAFPIRDAAGEFDSDDVFSLTARQALEDFADDLESRALAMLN